MVLIVVLYKWGVLLNESNEQYFPVLLFIVFHNVVKKSVDQKSLGATTEVKATEPYFPVVFFIVLYKLVLTLSLCLIENP